MTSEPGRRAAQVSVADALRDLSEALITKAIPEVTLLEVAAAISDQSSRLQPFEPRDLRSVYRDWVKSGCAGETAVIERPAAGPANPTAVPVVCRRTADGFEADIVVPEVFASWPGSVQGGVIAGILDDVLGQTASAAIGFAATTRLEIEFRRPTPTQRPLEVATRPLEGEGRHFIAEAVIRDGDQILVRATGKFASLADAGLVF